MKSFTLLLLASAAAAQNQVIRQSSRDPTINQQLGNAGGTITINPNIHYWLSGRSTHNVFGTVDNFGDIILSQTDFIVPERAAGNRHIAGLRSAWHGGRLRNNEGAFFSVNDFGADTGATYNWILDDFVNEGGLQFCGLGAGGQNTLSVVQCRGPQCVNNGLIDFGSYGGASASHSGWRGAHGQIIAVNNGAIRITNTLFQAVTPYSGEGCWVIQEGGYLNLAHGVWRRELGTEPLAGQSIYFPPQSPAPNGAFPTLAILAENYVNSGVFGARIYGFGAGRAIELGGAHIIEILAYSPSGGVLNLRVNRLNQVVLKIGPGYELSQFFVGNNPSAPNRSGGLAVFYRGPAPAGRPTPSQCIISRPECADPRETAGPFVPRTSSTTTTRTATATATAITTSLTTTTTATTTSTTLFTATTTIVPGTGPCANGAGLANVYTARNGAVYGICLNTDFSGGDFGSPQSGISTVEGCAEACSTLSRCVSSSFVRSGRICYFKNVLNTASANPNVDSIFLVSGGTPGTTTTTTTTITTTTPTSTPPTPTVTGTGLCPGGAPPARTYTAPGGAVFGVCLNADFPGGDFGSPAPGVSTPEGCADACARLSGCVAGSLLRGGRVCYLKSRLSTASPNAGVDSVYLISGGSAPGTTTAPTTTISASSAPTTLTTTTLAPGTGPCAGGTGPVRTVTASNGAVYGVCANTDFPGNDVGSAAGSTANACAEACSRISGCVSASLLRAANVCYFKSNIPQGTPNQGVDSVYLISGGSTPGATTTTTTTTPAPTSTGFCANGRAPTRVITADNGARFGVCPETDFVGPNIDVVQDIVSLERLAHKCSTTPGCVAATTIKGVSQGYLKNVLNIPGEGNQRVDSIYLL